MSNWKIFKGIKNTMIRSLKPTDELLTALYVVFIIGGDNLKLVGRNNIRLRASIIKAFDEVSEEEDNLVRKCFSDKNLYLTQEQYELIDKCFDVFECKTGATNTIAQCLDWFSAAEKLENGQP